MVANQEAISPTPSLAGQAESILLLGTSMWNKTVRVQR